MKYVSAGFGNNFRLLDELSSIAWRVSTEGQPWLHIWPVQFGLGGGHIKELGGSRAWSIYN